jgi:hypothetical protein
MRAFLLMLLSVVTLEGCATSGHAQQDAIHVHNELAALANRTQPCHRQLETLPKYASLYQKLAISSTSLRPPTEAQLEDPEKPTPEMIQLGMEWYAQDEVCTKETVEGMGRIDPQLGIVSTGWLIEIADIYQDAINNAPTYGHINVRLLHLRQREHADIVEWNRQLAARLKQRQDSEDAKALETKAHFTSALRAVSQFAANALIAAVEVVAARQAALAQTQQHYVLLVPSYRPVQITRTTCSYVGSVFTCQQVAF